jgi:type IV pilus assembly protein PilM
MASTNTCWGIELGAGSIKALKLERDGDDLKVRDFAVIPHKRPLSTPDLDLLDATRVAMGELVSSRDLSGAQVAISVPGHSSFARFAKLPPVEPKKIPDIVKFEAVQQIPFPIDQVEWDYQVFTTKDNPDVEVGIFAITREKVMERVSMWQDVGITPTYVTLGPLAAYNAVSFDQQFNAQTPGTVILDIGTTSTDLIISEPGRVWIRTFPIGGHNFTMALVDAFKLSYLKAEALKRQAEQSKHFRHILQAMRPVFSDLAQDVQRSIGYYQSSHRDANLTRLIGLGSTFQLPGLRKYLSQQLQMEVVRLESFAKLNLEGPMAGEFQAATLNLATAYGLCLQGLGFDHGIMANLMPVPVVRKSLWSKKTKWFAVAAGLSLAAGGVSFIKPVVDRMQYENQTESQDIAAVKRQTKELRDAWKDVEAKLLPNPEAANVMSLLTEREVHAHLVNDLAQVLAVARDEAAKDAKPNEKPQGLIFSSFLTDYIPTAASSPDGSDAGSTARRIRVTLNFATTRKGPDATRFVESTVRNWVRSHRIRDGVPYFIIENSFSMPNPRTETITEDPRSGSPDWKPTSPDGNNPGGTPPGGAAPPGGGAPPRRGDDRGGGAGGLGGGGRPPGGGAPTPPGGGFPQGGGDVPNPVSQDESKAADELGKMAPIPPAPKPAKVGDIITRFTVTWEVEIGKPPEASAENKS